MFLFGSEEREANQCGPGCPHCAAALEPEDIIELPPMRKREIVLQLPSRRKRARTDSGSTNGGATDSGAADAGSTSGDSEGRVEVDGDASS